jgi:DNA-binding beta-propeller fold protein YncE
VGIASVRFLQTYLGKKVMKHPAIILGVLLATPSFLWADKIVVAQGEPALGETKVVQPFAVDFAADGSTYFVEMAGGEKLRQILADGKVVTLAGSGKKGDKDGPALQAEFNGMHNLLVAPDGNIYLADAFNFKVRKYDAQTKTVSTFAGTGKKGFSGDGGPAEKAQFDQTICIAFGPGAKTLYVADIGNRRIRAIDLATKIVTTVAGNGQKGVPVDGKKATEQPLVDPRAVASDDAGNLYILERGGHALRVVNKAGEIKTVAGTGKAGKGGDGGPALQAAMNGPKLLWIEKSGSVLIADTENHQIRRYIPGKEVIERVAGIGTAGASGVDGDPLKVQLKRPHGASPHPITDEIYIADSDNNRVLKIVK